MTASPAHPVGRGCAPRCLRPPPVRSCCAPRPRWSRRGRSSPRLTSCCLPRTAAPGTGTCARWPRSGSAGARTSIARWPRWSGRSDWTRATRRCAPTCAGSPANSPTVHPSNSRTASRTSSPAGTPCAPSTSERPTPPAGTRRSACTTRSPGSARSWASASRPRLVIRPSWCSSPRTRWPSTGWKNSCAPRSAGPSWPPCWTNAPAARSRRCRPEPYAGSAPRSWPSCTTPGWSAPTRRSTRTSCTWPAPTRISAGRTIPRWCARGWKRWRRCRGFTPGWACGPRRPRPCSARSSWDPIPSACARCGCGWPRSPSASWGRWTRRWRRWRPSWRARRAMPRCWRRWTGCWRRRGASRPCRR